MIQVNRIYLIFNRLVTKKFLVDTSDVTIFISTIIPKQSTDYVIKQKDIWLNREKDVSSSIKTRLLFQLIY
jgi:hypothetical protein